ncbi:hypothetical protein FSHL1_003260 [Fusarium sambucinum]
MCTTPREFTRCSACEKLCHTTMFPTKHCEEFWRTGACPHALYPTTNSFMAQHECHFCNPTRWEKDEQKYRNDAHDQRDGEDASGEETSNDDDRNGEESDDNTEKTSAGHGKVDAT